MSLNEDLSNLFSTFAALMEIKGESVFKAIAFSKVSRILSSLTVDLRKVCEDGTLKNIEGLGESSCRIINEFVKTGRSTDFDEVAASVPAGLLPLLGITGLGPKTIALLWKERNVTSLEELVKAIDSGALAGLKGIGEKKIQAIKEGIAMRSQAAVRMGIGDALPIAESLVQRLRAMKPVKQAEIAGSLRRRRDTIGDVDLLCALKDPAAAGEVAEAFVKFPEVQKILGQGNTKASVLTAGGLQVDLRIVPADNFGAALMYFTGSKDHNVKLRSRAQDMDLTLNEWGLYKISEYDKAAKKSGEAPAVKAVANKTEAEVYKALGLPWIEPELRESRGEMDAALAGKLPKLITIADIRGDLHTHTTASDGENSIDEMARAAIALGYEFLAITDHSKSQVIANGLSAERLLKHVAEIRKANDRIKGITLLAGCEVDILVDGRMDYEDEILAELDIVIGSPHVSLKQDEQKATDRLLRAIDNKYVNVIGHPTGRLINKRAGLPIDIGKITAAAAASGTALEINAGYPRLDLNDVHARTALEAGAMLAIDTDAHSTPGLGTLGLGLDVARRAWATPENVINCMTVGALKKFLGKKRDR
ncbi:MAG TPA: DNA polymerase/3'-5' exonuclease PolX [Tepidisphaeraceae bacterium]|nr:DNA polymerase/3'-5' exonuclease PolX [Tepidisphaeraceae bacterium]